MTVFTVHVEDELGNPINGSSIRIIDNIDIESGETNADGNYVTGDLPFPTLFSNGEAYFVLVDYWTATQQDTYALWTNSPQQLDVTLKLFEGGGQIGGLGEKTLTINANNVECNHILAINETQETSFIFGGFPGQFLFDPGDTITLTAYPQSGYEFSDWGEETCNPISLVPTEDTSITAVFNFIGLPPTSTEEIINLPKPVIVLGSVFVDEKDVVSCNVHLGVTREVSSFEVVLQNWGKKYSPNGWFPLSVGGFGGIGVCRVPFNPNVLPLISLKVESLKYESTPEESFVTVSGRCWGEKLFRRTVTKTYENAKGEAVVKDLLDNFVGLSHYRSGNELVESTDTAYSRLEYVDTPVWDVLTYIASSADRNGVIGFDFRVAPDGKFEFFPKNSKTANVDLAESIEKSEYSKDITSVRNKVTIYGAADKSLPLDKDAWTEILNPTEGAWTYTGNNGSVAQDNSTKAFGTSSVKVHLQNDWFGMGVLTFNVGYEVNCELYPELNVWINAEVVFEGNGVSVTLTDVNNRSVNGKPGCAHDGQWNGVSLGVGSKFEDKWLVLGDAGFDWTHVKKVSIAITLKQDLSLGQGDFWIDGLYFGGRRYSAVQEDPTSQYSYGLREFVDTDDELFSDSECGLRARAILDHLKSPAESLKVSSTVIDYGTALVLAGDQVHVELPNENVEGDFRVNSVEYSVKAGTQELEVKLELGREAVLLADYVYALRSKVDKVNRIKVAK